MIFSILILTGLLDERPRLGLSILKPDYIRSNVGDIDRPTIQENPGIVRISTHHADYQQTSHL